MAFMVLTVQPAQKIIHLFRSNRLTWHGSCSLSKHSPESFFIHPRGVLSTGEPGRALLPGRITDTRVNGGLTFNGNNVKIYKKAGANLTPAQMAEAVEKFQNGFDDNSGVLGSGILNGMISEINIFTGSIGYDYYSYDNNMVLDLNFNEIGAAGDYLVSVSMGLIPKGDFAMVKPSNNIRLANVNNFPTSRQLVAFQKG
jgi:hypothetical protein